MIRSDTYYPIDQTGSQNPPQGWTSIMSMKWMPRDPMSEQYTSTFE